MNRPTPKSVPNVQAAAHMPQPTQEAVMPASKTKKTQDPTPAEFQQMVKETRQKMQTPGKRGKKAKPAPEATPEPTDLLADFRAQLGELVPTLEPRQAIAMVLNGRLMYGAVLSIKGATASILRISSGWLEMPLEECAPAALVPGTGLAAGDLVTLTMRPGLWRITRQDVDAAAYACELVSDPSETAFTPLSGARVVRRANLADTCRDLGQEPGAVAALEVTLSKDADLPFPVTEAELEAAIVEPAPAPDLVKLRVTFPVGAPVSWQQSSGDQGELGTLTGVVVSHDPPSILGYCTVAPALSASAPRTDVKMQDLTRTDPSEAAARLPYGTAVEFLSPGPDFTPVLTPGTVMNYIWDEPCEQVTGYLIATTGEEEFSESWLPVSRFDDSLTVLDLPAQDAPESAEPDYETLFPVGSRVLVDDGTTGTVHSHYNNPQVPAVDGVRADGCFVAPDGWDGNAEALHDVAHVQLKAAPELPAEPGPILDTTQITWLPVSALIPSPLNPRKKFPQEALDSLANSIAAKGLMQNLVGRVMPGADTVEVIAGGRRLRALTLLRDAGRIPDDYAVPVRVQDMTDLDALMLAVSENSERADVEPLEEADAFVEMIRLGASVEDIALRFKCSARTVEKRLVLAEGLGNEARALLADGKIVISQAQVIAQTTGPLREHVVKAAVRGDTAQRLRSMIASCTFLVDRAKFDVATSGLEIVEDLFGDQPARFADPQAALALQLAWVEERRKALSKKKEQHFVDVVKLPKEYLHLPHDTYTTYGAPDNIKGTVIMVSTQTGEVKQERCAREADVKSARAKEQAKERAQSASEATGSDGGAIRKSAWVDAHRARATALRAALVGDHKRTVALTILSILQADPVSLRASLEYAQATAIPTGLARLKEIDAKTGGQLGVNSHHLPKRPITKEFRGYEPEGKEVLPYLDVLMALTLEDLLDVQSVLIAQAVGGWNEYNPMHAPYAFVTRLAADTGATVQMPLTDEHLKAYPRDRLIELAEDAGIAQGHGLKDGHISSLSTNKDIRAAILQHADALAQRGYVPPLARFPEVADTAQARKYRQDAKDLVARLDGQQISSLLEDLGIDPTDDAAANGLNVLQQEIDDMSDDELQQWQGLRDMAQQIHATAAD
ncbi:ParB/Srx family N-terminal domain-containing protein [Deinococcus soli (ex Cha et al. 2016)]|uniref:ParB/RepB/Spo0J family partition protein n=1 Tax=Deinococcus soli (ex Cha et al. 2016) TaxID=1309411 RepID=A0ACC6KLZ9_9DEIO|nr:ParB/Srx family N-terminal domain-containing protein [Deinococcus soli (ex Cha et al. 2016)]MDR6753461.1 ParB/RepB/Spo0J family partition protein [Deinococcus soli (ex Cha et al. 2016)]